MTHEIAALNIQDNLTAAGSSSSTWSYGAGVASGNGNLTVNQSIVNVISGAAGNVVGGGRTEKGGSVTVDTVNMTISGGSVETAAAGVYVNKGGVGTVNNAVLTLDASAVTVFGGGMVIGDGSMNMGSSVVNITANASVSSSVFAGSHVTGGSSVSNSVTLNFDGTGINPVAKGVYGGDFVTGGSGTVKSVSININSGNLSCCVMAGGYASGGTSVVENAVVTVSGSANMSGYIYLGGYSDGGDCQVGNASAVFTGESTFSGSVLGYGFVGNGGSSTVSNATVTLQNYSGTFAGNLVDIDKLFITADSNVTLTGNCGSGLIDVTGATAETVSHNIFDLAVDFSIDNIRVDGAALQQVEEWTGPGFGYNASEGKFAVVQAADKDQFAGYTFYTTLA